MPVALSFYQPRLFSPFFISFSLIATHPFETARKSVLPLWTPSAQARRSAPASETVMHARRTSMIQLGWLSPTLARLHERLTIEEPVGSGLWSMATTADGALIWSSYFRGPSTVQASSALSDSEGSMKPPFSFKMAQELTFPMLARSLKSFKLHPRI